MTITLQSILRDTIVYPYDTTTMKGLSDACQTYSSEISLDSFEACLLYLCQDIPFRGFVSQINSSVNKQLPDRVYRALAGYVITLAMENKDIPAEKKVLFSLAIRNVMVFSFTSTDPLIQKCISPNYYSPYETFWERQSKISDLPKTKLFPGVFNARTFNELGCTVDEVYPAIQVLAKQHARAVYYGAISQIKQQDGENEFCFASRVVDELLSYDWDYVDPNPVDTIKRTGLKSIKRMSLSQIKDILNNNDYEDDSFAASSVLLQYLYKGEFINLSEFKMNPLHFAIVLYFEWMYETLKENNNE